MAVNYDRFNKTIPRGDGKCNTCHGTGYMYGGSYGICISSHGNEGGSTCSRCNGSGTDQFGAHCTECDSNHGTWGGGENYPKLQGLFDYDDEKSGGDDQSPSSSWASGEDLFERVTREHRELVAARQQEFDNARHSSDVGGESIFDRVTREHHELVADRQREYEEAGHRGSSDDDD